MITIKDYAFINQFEKYGNSIIIKKSRLRLFNIILAVVVPVIYPIPVAIFINKICFKRNIIIRY